MNFRMIMNEYVPCWYELSWHGKIGGITVRIHEDFIGNSPQVAGDLSYIEYFKKEFGFKDFGNTFTADFGFERCFLFQGVSDGFHEFLVKVPRVKTFEDTVCPHCNGKKKGGFGKCMYCDGHGKPYHYDYQQAYAISATFTLFTQYASIIEEGKETSAKIPQLLTVRTVTIKDSHGGSLSGDYGIHLGRFLSSLPQHTAIDEMVGPMQKAWEIMDGEKFLKNRGGMFGFEAYIANNSGWLNVSCPGDACGLHPSHHSSERGCGYEFSCHNTDTPMQQLTLLAGLAGLHDKARREIIAYTPWRF